MRETPANRRCLSRPVPAVMVHGARGDRFVLQTDDGCVPRVKFPHRSCHTGVTAARRYRRDEHADLACCCLLRVAASAAPASILIAACRCRPGAARRCRTRGAPPVSIVRPVCGIDNYGEATLRSTFELDYPSYEILFCVASPRDPVLPLVERLIADHPACARAC